jgi:hypothetical protein
MNCKPGDLAVVIRDQLLKDAVVVRSGQLVKVVRLTEANVGAGHVWQIEEPIRFVITLPLPFGLAVAMSGEVLGIDDSELRPIRGNEVTDEQVRELFTPSPLKEVA